MTERMATPDGVRRAAERLKGKALLTPLIENETLNEKVGGRILMKAEVLQHCGSFKFRGAYNLLSQMNPNQRKRGVLAWSSGNHAQGVALAAKLLDIPATIPDFTTYNVRARAYDLAGNYAVSNLLRLVKFDGVPVITVDQ
ncbi:MAG TPA: pyridoxal-phosphate dependent enzyme, partial [Amphiplicatus sp.]|nr:pyridoxal-phosphate dependent enzyme [Amphiplicatus sp.]